MITPKSVNPAEFLREQAAAGPDVLRAMVKTFADASMSAETGAVCGTPVWTAFAFARGCLVRP